MVSKKILNFAKMDRYVGIDFGRKRIGVAVSDPLGLFSTALDTVDSAKIIDYLKNYARNETVKGFVVGYPVNMDGLPSEAASGVEGFISLLEKSFPGVPVMLEDERFTSVLAHRVMIDGGMKASRRRDKKEVDRISAAIILQSFLDRQNGSSAAVPDPGAVPATLSVKSGGRRKK